MYGPTTRGVTPLSINGPWVRGRCPSGATTSRIWAPPSGSCVGEGAYGEFKKLATVFYAGGPGLLVHPVWQTSNAYFVELSLRQEPRADYVGYSFAFWEGYDGHSTGVQVTGGGGEPETGPAASTAGERRHTVRQGETLWGIARDYGLSLTELIALNPQIKNPNLILAGEEVRLA